jgi:hypothetical protein
MSTVGTILLFVGLIIILIYSIQLLIVAFKTSVLWGLGFIFVPFVNLIFLLVHWDEAKSPFLKGLLGIPFCMLGAYLTDAGAPSGVHR